MSKILSVPQPSSLVKSVHFWIIILLFLLTTICHFHELLEGIPVLGQISIGAYLGLQRHAEDRLIYILIVTYATWAFGLKVGASVLLGSVIVMIPRAVFVSPAPTDAIFESFTAAAIGVMLVVTVRAYRAVGAERDKAEDVITKLTISEENYRELFQNASDAIWVHDLKGNIIDANRATGEMTGCTVEQLRQMNVVEFLSPDAHVLANTIKDKLIRGEPVQPRYEQRLLNKVKGTDAIVQLTTRLIKQEGKPVGFQNIARDITEERKMRDGMRFYLQKVLVAQEEERKRIARELHDDSAQSLLLLIRRLDSISYDAENRLPDDAREKLTRVHDYAVEILAGLRRYAQVLRPAILDDLGLVAALEWMADNLSREGVEVEANLDLGGQSLPHEIELGLFRIAQEALLNISKHAHASRVEITLRAASDHLEMVIADDGKGFDIPVPLSQISDTGKLGLVGMQERANLLRGTLLIDSAAGKGTRVIVQVPLGLIDDG
ncbi:MAG: PAS domain-containing sensor histidine kinase [Dehalococcoidia bacterium]|nr:PAS domain-containing sensor histidine kinase [Dehalococcoidia bacterium]